MVVKGSVEVYERDGRYQLYAAEITQDGTGDLFKRFEKLRNELEEMGMFAPEYKSPIPKYAMKVGIVTASTGAAIRDIINIARRAESLRAAGAMPRTGAGRRSGVQYRQGDRDLGCDGA